jgi:ParB-like chromosome segregation protein Spo0J
MTESFHVIKRISITLPIEQLVDSMPDEPFDEAVIKLLKKSMTENGFTTPIPVYNPEPDITMLVSGRHRRRAAMELGFKEIPCVLLTFSQPGYNDLPRARIDAWENAARRGMTTAEMAFRVAELARIEEVAKEEGTDAGQRKKAPSSTNIVAAQLGIPRQKVESSKAIASLPQDVLDAAEEAGLTQHDKLHQLARVPAERRLEAIPKLAATPKSDLPATRRVAQEFGAKVGNNAPKKEPALVVEAAPVAAEPTQTPPWTDEASGEEPSLPSTTLILVTLLDDSTWSSSWAIASEEEKDAFYAAVAEAWVRVKGH